MAHPRTPDARVIDLLYDPRPSAMRAAALAADPELVAALRAYQALREAAAALPRRPLPEGLLAPALRAAAARCAVPPGLATRLTAWLQRAALHPTLAVALSAALVVGVALGVPQEGPAPTPWAPVAASPAPADASPPAPALPTAGASTSTPASTGAAPSDVAGAAELPTGAVVVGPAERDVVQRTEGKGVEMYRDRGAYAASAKASGGVTPAPRRRAKAHGPEVAVGHPDVDERRAPAPEAVMAVTAARSKQADDLAGAADDPVAWADGAVGDLAVADRPDLAGRFGDVREAEEVPTGGVARASAHQRSAPPPVAAEGGRGAAAHPSVAARVALFRALERGDLAAAERALATIVATDGESAGTRRIAALLARLRHDAPEERARRRESR